MLAWEIEIMQTSLGKLYRMYALSLEFKRQCMDDGILTDDGIDARMREFRAELSAAAPGPTQRARTRERLVRRSERLTALLDRLYDALAQVPQKAAYAAAEEHVIRQRIARCADLIRSTHALWVKG
jgi:hypothetical protein